MYGLLPLAEFLGPLFGIIGVNLFCRIIIAREQLVDKLSEQNVKFLSNNTIF